LSSSLDLKGGNWRYNMTQQRFDSSAYYYAKYRYNYPEQFYHLLENKCHLTGHGRLLDLACGTGFLAIALSRYFSEVFAVDISEPMLEQAAIASKNAGCNNITWQYGSAEELSDKLGEFDLVTIGRAIHWMNAEIVLPWIHQHLTTNGCLVLTNEADNFMWDGDEKWHRKVVELLEKYTHKKLPKRQEIFVDMDELLAQYSFANVETIAVPLIKKRNIDELIGFLFSTSICSKQLMKGKEEEFKQEMREELLRLNPSNDFTEEVRVSVTIGYKNGSGV
jgi:SAM-dependent methyltransferase